VVVKIGIETRDHSTDAFLDSTLAVVEGIELVDQPFLVDLA